MRQSRNRFAYSLVSHLHLKSKWTSMDYKRTNKRGKSISLGQLSSAFKVAFFSSPSCVWYVYQLAWHLLRKDQGFDSISSSCHHYKRLLQFQIGPTSKAKKHDLFLYFWVKEKSFKTDIGKESDTYGLSTLFSPSTQTKDYHMVFLSYLRLLFKLFFREREKIANIKVLLSTRNPIF